LDESIALESPNISDIELIRRRESDVSSIYSSGEKKRKKDGVADALFEIAKIKPNYDLDKIRVDMMVRKEERLNENNDREKEKNDREKQKMTGFFSLFCFCLHVLYRYVFIRVY
jgi:hypothetical protein